MSRYSGQQGKGAARRVRELKQDEAEARNGAPVVDDAERAKEAEQQAR